MNNTVDNTQPIICSKVQKFFKGISPWLNSLKLEEKKMYYVILINEMLFSNCEQLSLKSVYK